MLTNPMRLTVLSYTFDISVYVIWHWHCETNDWTCGFLFRATSNFSMQTLSNALAEIEWLQRQVYLADNGGGGGGGGRAAAGSPSTPIKRKLTRCERIATSMGPLSLPCRWMAVWDAERSELLHNAQHLGWQPRSVAVFLETPNRIFPFEQRRSCFVLNFNYFPKNAVCGFAHKSRANHAFNHVVAFDSAWPHQMLARSLSIRRA